MAVPTFSTISPATGPAGGRNAVVVTGTGFQIPPAVPALGTVTPQPPTVEVRVDGVRALEVAVLDVNTLRFVAPPFSRRGESATADPLPRVSITITNIDQYGVPIPGETVTAQNVYLFHRSHIRPPGETEEQQVYRQVIREVVELFQRQLLPNVAIGTSVDFGDRGEIIIKDAVVPSLTLTGPRIVEDNINRHHWAQLEEVDIDFVSHNVYWPSFVATMMFSSVLVSNNRRELYGLVQGFIELFSRNPFVRIPVIFGQHDGEHFEFPLHLESPPNIEIQNANSDLSVATSMFEVRLVPFRLTEPVAVEYKPMYGALESQQIDGTVPRSRRFGQLGD